MSKISPIVLGMFLVAAGGSMAVAQDTDTTPPKVLLIEHETLKMGKSPQAHDRSGAAFASIAARAKQQGHYVALDSMTGTNQAMYIARYASFDEWEKDNKLVDGNAALTAEMDRAFVAEGEFAERPEAEVFTFNEDWSFHPHPDLSHARYYDISIFHIRSGHRKDFNDCVKMVKDANEKAGTASHWAAYEIAYGGEANTVIALTHRDSLSEIDKDFADGKKFAEAMGGEDGMQKLDEVCGQGADSSRTELYAINPKQSYPEESWIKADPDFWKPKAKAPESAAAKPSPAKPAAATKPGGN